MNMKKKSLSRKRIALLLAFALIAGLLPLKTPAVSKASGYGVSNPRITEGVTTWDCIWFGNYWQGDTNGDGESDQNDRKTPIKWRVLSVNGNDAFLVANQGLDCKKYNETRTQVTWETCTLRSWMNGYPASKNICQVDYASANFLDDAFTDEEQSAIKTTNVINEDNAACGTEGGKNTSDKVYLLSQSEVTNQSYGFCSIFEEHEKTRVSVPTEFAKKQWAILNNTDSKEGLCWCWWLRSPGVANDYANCVDFDGWGYIDGGAVSRTYCSVRPALHLDLSSTSSWSYAGTVTSDGGGRREGDPCAGRGYDPGTNGFLGTTANRDAKI